MAWFELCRTRRVSPFFGRNRAFLLLASKSCEDCPLWAASGLFKGLVPCVPNYYARKIWKKMSTSAVGINKKLRRLSSVGRASHKNRIRLKDWLTCPLSSLYRFHAQYLPDTGQHTSRRTSELETMFWRSNTMSFITAHSARHAQG